MTKLPHGPVLELLLTTMRRRIKRLNWCRSLAQLVLFTGVVWGPAGVARADNARFDLAGPKVDLRVTRAGMTLPIAAVPNLQPGDRLWLHPDLPETQSVRYLMVVVFLRGTTNPPPENWFVRIETWDKKVRAEGVEVTVPDEAQQAVLFLAPVTGGDFATLRSAVQGRPGVFVRATQDLNLAGFEQARIEKYIASMRQVPQVELSDPKALQEHSNLIAGTLALKPNGDCIKLAPDQQYTCLTQSGSQTLLDDGHGESIVSAISSGPGSDFINAASATSLAGGGVYSAYVGAIVDLVRIMGSLHTAHYQYIPAIAFPDGAALNLRLNAAPSFHNPKSVIVIGLPSIQATAAPPLRPTDPKLVSCLAKPGLTVPMEGAPLVFSTAFAHDLVLHINYPEGVNSAEGRPQDIPLVADAYQGGLVVGSASARKPLPIAKVTLPTAPVAEGVKPAGAGSAGKAAAISSDGLTGTIEGFWGFDTFKGPTVLLQSSPAKDWKVASRDALIAGKDGEVLVTAEGTACIDTITLESAPGKSAKERWKPGTQPNSVDVAVKLSDEPANDPRTLKLVVHQFGTAEAATLDLVSYAEPAKLSSVVYHAGDTSAVLTGSSLTQVKQVELGRGSFVPMRGSGSQSGAELRLGLAPGASAPAASAGESIVAKVTLNDGRVLSLPVTVQRARPAVALISKAASGVDAQQVAGLAIKLGSADDLPLTENLTFSVKSVQPFPRDARLEVASVDGGFHVDLTLGAGTLVLQDQHTVLATLNPTRTFGASGFGPVQFRVVEADGSAGDWIPLVTLVRLPTITGVDCGVARSVGDSSGTKPDASSAPPGSPARASAGTEAVRPQGKEQVSAGTGATTCVLNGSSLFLIEAIGPDASLVGAAQVPEGFVGNTLKVPAPFGGQYYLRLRDDPAATNVMTLPQP